MVSSPPCFPQGTSSSRFLVFDADTEELVSHHQIAVENKYPKEGWCEQDPMELLESVKKVQCVMETVHLNINIVYRMRHMVVEKT